MVLIAGEFSTYAKFLQNFTEI